MKSLRLLDLIRVSLALGLLLIGFAPREAQAEDVRSGTLVKTVKEADILKDPADPKSSQGLLPKGTLLMLTGERNGQFVGVEVELEDGDMAGWMARDTVEADSGEDLPDPQPRRRRRGTIEEPEDTKRSRRSRIMVPKDEGILMKREHTFLYGVHLGGNVSMLYDDVGSSYLGYGAAVGAHVGRYLLPNVPVRVSAGYTIVNGVADAGGGVPQGTLLTFGMFDVAIDVAYTFARLEIFGFAQYSYGASVNNIPMNLGITAPADVSSAWFGGGAAYRLPLNEVADLMVRGKYGFSMYRSPIGFGSFSLMGYLEFRG